MGLRNRKNEPSNTQKLASAMIDELKNPTIDIDKETERIKSEAAFQAHKAELFEKPLTLLHATEIAATLRDVRVPCLDAEDVAWVIEDLLKRLIDAERVANTEAARAEANYDRAAHLSFMVDQLMDFIAPNQAMGYMAQETPRVHTFID